MQFDNQKTRNVAEAVAKILAGETVSEELKGNQHKIDKNKNNKIDAHDFEMLRKEKGVKQEASCDKMKKEETELTESHFKVGDEVKCKASGMEGKVVKVDEPQTGKYYTVKREDGKEMKYAPDELKLDEATKPEETKFHKDLDTLVHKTFGKRKDEMKEENLDEATPSRQQVKQAIGIARDKRYAGGNMTGAMKAMSKINKGLGQHPAVAKELKKQNEDVEQLDEYTPDKSGVTRIQGRAYGASKPEKHAVDTMSGPTRKELTAIEKEKKVKKPFKEMLELYAEKGLKALSEMTMTEEPDQEQFEKELAMAKKKATQKKTPEDEAKVAKSLVQSVKIEEEVDGRENKNTHTHTWEDHEAEKKHGAVLIHKYHEGPSHIKNHTEHGYFIYHKKPGKKAKLIGDTSVHVHNKTGEHHHSESRTDDSEEFHEHDPHHDHAVQNVADNAGVHDHAPWKHTKDDPRKMKKEEVEQINERPMTDTEMKKREDIVMGMKKNLQGFKDRYGNRAKDVMYATATKQAMKDED